MATEWLPLYQFTWPFRLCPSQAKRKLCNFMKVNTYDISTSNIFGYCCCYCVQFYAVCDIERDTKMVSWQNCKENYVIWLNLLSWNTCKHKFLELAFFVKTIKPAIVSYFALMRLVFVDEEINHNAILQYLNWNASLIM